MKDLSLISLDSAMFGGFAVVILMLLVASFSLIRKIKKDKDRFWNIRALTMLTLVILFFALLATFIMGDSSTISSEGIKEETSLTPFLWVYLGETAILYIIYYLSKSRYLKALKNS